nr:cytochrome c oxidase subunit II [Halorientalis salina]
MKLVGVVFLGIVALAAVGQVGLPLSRFDSTTETLIRTLNRQLLLVAVPLIVFVEAVLVYIVWRFRRKETPVPTPENRNLEIAWTIATAFVLVFVGVISYQVLAHPDVASTPDTAEPVGENVTEIEVVSHQWYYSAGYADANVSDERADVIYVPTDRPVRFSVTTTDVIHSFYVPDLGVKQDAIPGQENLVRTTVTEPGNYTLYCGEYCGEGHARMKTTVRALPPEEYRQRVDRLRGRAERNQSGLRVGLPES